MMADWKNTSKVLAISVLCLIFSNRVLAQSTHGMDVAVVVHPDTPVSNVNLTEVRRIFLGDRQYWNTNVPVVLLVRAPVARERNVEIGRASCRERVFAVV